MVEDLCGDDSSEEEMDEMELDAAIDQRMAEVAALVEKHGSDALVKGEPGTET